MRPGHRQPQVRNPWRRVTVSTQLAATNGSNLLVHTGFARPAAFQQPRLARAGVRQDLCLQVSVCRNSSKWQEITKGANALLRKPTSLW